MNAEAAQNVLAEFASRLTALNILLTPEQIGQLGEFCQLIAEFSKHTNIVGNSDLKILLENHILDSLTLLPFLKDDFAETNDGKPLKLLDLGSGAGFPAIPLAIALPNLEITMVEAVGKKCQFLETATSALGIANRTSVCYVRAEELAHDRHFRGKYNFGTARAVGNFDVTAELVMPFLKRGGVFISQKSLAQLPEEETRALACLPKLGCKLSRIEHLDEAILGKKFVLLLAIKTDETHSTYPRTWPAIKATPLANL